VLALAGATCAITVFVGVLVGFDYHGRSMRIPWAAQWRTLAQTTQEKVAGFGQWLGKVDGPRELKVRFRARPEGSRETFWCATDARAEERILVEHIGAQLIRFGYRRGKDAVIWGRPLRWEKDHTHTVSVQLPSLYDPAGHRGFRGARQDFEFREKTGVAVTFSGGNALGIVVEKLPMGIRPGGAVGADFTGEVRRVRPRLFRPEEVPAGLADPLARRGGTLRMKVVLPETLRPAGEPIFAAGAGFRSNILFVETAPGGVRFTYETYTIPRVSSPVLAVNPRGFLLEFEMPSFNPDLYGHEAMGDVVLRVDGVEMFRTRQVGYEFPWGHERLGENPFGTTCADLFRGWIYDGQWVRKNGDKPAAEKP
jgi:hypothetical protein